MKKTIAMLVIAFAALTSANAQSAVELAKQQKELNKINMELLNSKVSKQAKKEAKRYAKEGWVVPAGAKDIAHQITSVQLLEAELMADEMGNPTPRYIIRGGQSTSGAINTGVALARTNAQVELAAMLETRVAAALELKESNQQTSSITATTVEKFHERAKAIIDASLTNTRTMLTIYRELPNHNYQVQVQVAFDKKELEARLKRAMQQQLEMEGDEDLNGIVDDVLRGTFE